MPWTPPSDPVTSTVITVAYAVANLLTQIRWLRGLTGNADPPGTNYAILSDTTATTSWRKIPADALLPGAVVAQLGYTPLNAGGDVLAGQLKIFRSQGADAAAFNAAPLVVQSLDASVNAAETAGIGLHRSGASGIYLHHAGAAAAQILRIITSTGAVGSVFSELNMGTGSNLNADAVRTFIPGNAANQLAVNNGIVNSNLNADAVRGLVPSNATGQIPISNGTVNTNLVAASATSATSATTAANATLVGGRTPTATPTANAIPIADAGGKLDGWVTPASFSIPSGLGCWVRTAAEIPAGFARESQLDGLLPVGAGSSAGQTFVEFTNTGTTWAHTHTDSGHAHGSAAHTHGASALGIGGNTGAASGSGNQANIVTPNPASATQAHTHDQGTLDVTGSTDGTSLTTNNGSAVISSVTWIPPMRAVVWARKS
jgi:hypothetical protein